MNNLFMHLCTNCDFCDAVIRNGDAIIVSIKMCLAEL